MHRLPVALVVAGCRLHFDDQPSDAPPSEARPLALACNTPVKLADAPLGGKLSATATTTALHAGWIEPGGQLVGGIVDLVAADQAIGRIALDPGDTGFTTIAIAAAGDVIYSANTQNGSSFVELVDPMLRTVAGPTPLARAPGGPRAVAITGNATGPVAAVTTITPAMSQTTIFGIASDATLTAPLAVAAANPVAQSSLTNIGDRLAVVNTTSVANCTVRTIDLAITSAGATAGWGTTNQCTQPQLGYAPGRSDALLVRHDMTDGDINHDIATRSALTYTIPGEMRLRNPANEARPVGVADGYWVSYETGGTLEVVHVDFAGTVGAPVVLGPLADPTAHGTILHGTDVYVVWVQDGLELARVCP